MTSEGLGEMFEGESADMCAGKYPLLSMGGRAEGLACANLGARTPIGVSGNSLIFLFFLLGENPIKAELTGDEAWADFGKQSFQ